MFSKISNVVRYVFLVVWIPSIIVISPLFLIMGIALKLSLEEITQDLYNLMLLKL